MELLDWIFGGTYLIANSVGLVGTVLDRVITLGDTVVVFCAADHFEMLFVGEWKKGIWMSELCGSEVFLMMKQKGFRVNGCTYTWVFCCRYIGLQSWEAVTAS